MTESLDPVEHKPDTPHSDRVNPADRSNPEKKDNGFSNALKEKMKEKLKSKARQQDEVIIDDGDGDDQQSAADKDEYGEQTAEASDVEDDPDDHPPEHVDLKA
ncbi:MAG: hypothetical protein JSU74_08715 [Candidatus Zixiibacteriota bacterium]|nr:MAG: hypothetical protein JSU74_08715 [candidate division Zixibacteria bacterium]